MPARDKSINDVTALFAAAGYARTDADLLQPADVFIDFSGEDIRRRLFLTQNAEGLELCLRPEFTIPVSRAYLAAKQTAPKNFCYAGPVFRHRAGESGEFAQAGIESFGRNDREAADAEILDLALQAAETLGGRGIVTRIGDIALLGALLAALKFPAGLVRRLKRALASGQPIDPLFNAAADASGAGDYSGILKAIDGVDQQAARAFVEDMLSISGIQAAGGRSVSEIAARFVDQARQGRAPVAAETLGLLKQFLALEGEPDDVSAAARDLAKTAKLDVSAALDSFDTRTGFMAARGIDVSKLQASPAFARALDYYTGFIFEVTSAGARSAKAEAGLDSGLAPKKALAEPGRSGPGEPVSAAPRPLIGGGRYDSLLARLGAKADIPAVGFAIWLERFGGRA